MSLVPNTLSGLQRAYLEHVREIEILKETIRKCDGVFFRALNQLDTHASATGLQRETEKVLVAYKGLIASTESAPKESTNKKDGDKLSIIHGYENPEKSPTLIPIVMSKICDDEVGEYARSLSTAVEKNGTETISGRKETNIDLERLLKLLQLLITDQITRKEIELRVMGKLKEARKQLREGLVEAGIEIFLP